MARGNKSSADANADNGGASNNGTKVPATEAPASTSLVETNEHEDTDMKMASDIGEFEDDFEDEYESEDELFDDDDDNDDAEMNCDADLTQGDHHQEKLQKQSTDDETSLIKQHGGNQEQSASNDTMKSGDSGIASSKTKAVKNAANKNFNVYLPGAPLQEGEQLEPDMSVYKMLHSLNVDWPCLSFDILSDRLGNDRTKFPHTAYIVAGTQAERPILNHIDIIKLTGLSSSKKYKGKDAFEGIDNDASDSESDSDDENDADDLQPIVQRSKLPFFGCVNRIRAMKTTSSDVKIVAAWSDARREVYVYDIAKRFDWFDIPNTDPKSAQLHRVEGHKDEGYALAWSPLAEGHLVSGDCAAGIRLTVATESGFKTSATSFTGHTSSVEDLQWSPTESTVFASCSADGRVAIFDTRLGTRPGIMSLVSSVDVNVISWNALTPFLLASGHDDGEFAIWDLRSFSSASRASTLGAPSKSAAAPSAAVAAARFNWHRKAVTSIEWHTHEESMLAVAGEDNQITIWDLSTEHDESQDSAVGAGASEVDPKLSQVPPQLLFVHQGQEDIKELHWHPQIPGCIVSTALTGFNVFKTINA